MAKQRYTTYCIKNPETGEIVYIGQTKDFERRKARHLTANAERPKIKTVNIKTWLFDTLATGRMPVIEALEECTTLAASLASETLWVAKLSAEGRGESLLNRWRVHRFVRELGMDRAAQANAPTHHEPIQASEKRARKTRALSRSEKAVEFGVRHGLGWTDEETATLERMAHQHCRLAEISAALGRSVRAVRLRLRHVGWQVPAGAGEAWTPQTPRISRAFQAGATSDWRPGQSD